MGSSSFDRVMKRMSGFGWSTEIVIFPDDGHVCVEF